MDKAVLVIDMPKNCWECSLSENLEVIPSVEECHCILTNIDVDKFDKPDWCPLKPVPEKYDVLAAIENNSNYDPSYDIGRNDCIDEIIGQ